MTMWTMKKARNENATRKWMVRALCRPPNIQGRKGNGAVHGRRHGQAGQHDQRPQHEDHDEIGHALDAVVVLGGLAFGKLQLGVRHDLVRQVLEVLLGRQQFFPEMAARKDIGEKRRAVDHQQPGEGEMPQPSQQRGPGMSRRKAACRHRAVYLRCAQHTGRVEVPRSELGDALCHFAVAAARGERQDRVIEIGALAPIERGMGVEYLQTAKQHYEQHDGVEPVRRAHKQAMAIKEIVRAFGREPQRRAQPCRDARRGGLCGVGG